MALSKRDAVTTARTLLNGARLGESRRLDRIAKAMRPTSDGSQVEVPPGVPEQMNALSRKSQTNYLPLIVDTLSQSLFVDGYRPAAQQDNARPWERWQANGMDARQTGINRSALTYGASYVVVSRGSTGSKLTGVSPRNLTAVYSDPDEDEWPMFAVRVDRQLVRLYDEEQVYTLGVEKTGRSLFSTVATLSTGGYLEFIDAGAHDLGVCPVVRFRDRMLLDGEEQMGVIEPLLSIQERVDETVFGLLVTQWYQAFKQRYVIGWTPEDEAEAFAARASQVWTFADEQVKVGEFAQASPAPFLESKDSAVRDMAAISQVPPQSLAVTAISNLSAESLAALEAGKDRKVNEIETSLGESYEQMFRLSALADGDLEAAADTSAQVRWRDATARSLAQTVDALGKMVQMLGIPPQAVWGRIPGTTDQDIEEWKVLAREGDAFGALTQMLNAAP